MDVDGVDLNMSPVFASPAIPAKAASAPVLFAISTLKDGNTEQTPNPRPMDGGEVRNRTATDGQDDETTLMDVDGASGTKDSSPRPSVSTDIDNPSQLPVWLTRNGMLGYLRGISGKKAWQQLLSSFFKFEIANTTNGVCKCFLVAYYHSMSELFYRTYPLLRARKRSRHGSRTRSRI